MSGYFLHVDHKAVVLGALIATSSIAVYSTWKYLSLKKQKIRENVYESDKYLSQFLVFHYGDRNDLVKPWDDFLNENLLNFTRNIVEVCAKHGKAKTRAMEIGCSVGGSTFELARFYDHVVGVDFSNLFIEKCHILKEHGSLSYPFLIEGDLTRPRIATVDPKIDRARTHFQLGDACDLPLSLGKFDCVLAANIICRLKKPKDFLHRMKDLVSSSGIFVIASPYAFMTDFTPKENWVGAWKNSKGDDYTGFDGIKDCLSDNFDLIEAIDLPMFMREFNREYYLAFSHVLVWRRK